jgi:hypothetical protein
VPHQGWSSTRTVSRSASAHGSTLASRVTENGAAVDARSLAHAIVPHGYGRASRGLHLEHAELGGDRHFGRHDDDGGDLSCARAHHAHDQAIVRLHVREPGAARLEWIRHRLAHTIARSLHREGGHAGVRGTTNTPFAGRCAGEASVPWGASPAHGGEHARTETGSADAAIAARLPRSKPLIGPPSSNMPSPSGRDRTPSQICERWPA